MATLSKQTVNKVMFLRISSVMMLFGFVTMIDVFDKLPTLIGHSVLAIAFLLMIVGTIMDWKLIKCPSCQGGIASQNLFWLCPNYVCPFCGENIELE